MGKTEKEKMLAGELYCHDDEQLNAEGMRARRIFRQFNDMPIERVEERRGLLRELLGSMGSDLEIQPPFYCDYGYNIEIGDEVFMNYGCVILDVNPVKIGDRTLLAPYVQIYTAAHPMDWSVRANKLEYGIPVAIGSDVWIGGGAIVCPGVNIGDRTVIGAGSVVTKDIPSDVMAAGNPCRVKRELK